MKATQQVSRRDVLRAAATTAAFTIVPRHVLGQGQTPPSEKLNIAGIGIGGQGGEDLKQFPNENIVALCDVDWGTPPTRSSGIPAPSVTKTTVKCSTRRRGSTRW